MSDQLQMPGCDPAVKPEPSAEEQAEIERLHNAWLAEKARRLAEEQHVLDKARWRMQAERSARRRLMTDAELAADDRREAAEEAQAEADFLEGEREEARWRSLTPAQRREERERDRRNEEAATTGVE